MTSGFHQSSIRQNPSKKVGYFPCLLYSRKQTFARAPAYVRKGPIATWKRIPPCGGSLIIRLGSSPAFCHEAVFGCSVERLTFAADRFGFAGILLAFLHETRFGCAVER